MKKLSLFAASLLVSISMNAATLFQLSIQNADAADADKRYVTITETNPDVFGDGKVSVEVNEEGRLVFLTMNNATLCADNADPVIHFDGRKECYLDVHLKGHCALQARGTGSVIALERGDLLFYGLENAVLDISGNAVIARLTGDAILDFDQPAPQPFTVNITTASADKPVFEGETKKSYGEEVHFNKANVHITRTAGDYRLAANLENIQSNGKIADGIWIDKTNENDVTFAKNGQPYEGNLTIVAPLFLSFGEKWVQVDDDLSDIKSANLKAGKISYDKATNTITLDNVDSSDRVYCAYDNCTIYLIGDNTFSTTNYQSRFQMGGDNNLITGDPDATVTFYCGGTSEAVYSRGALEINGIRQLIAFATRDGIVCYDKSQADDILTIAAPIEIQCAENRVPVRDFADVVITNPELQLTQFAELNYHPIYDKTQKKFINQEDNSDVPYIAYEFPVYIKFYDTPVYYRNMNDIQIPNSEGKASYNRETGVLTLNNFKNTTEEPANAIVGLDRELKIKLIGDNEIQASDNVIEAEYLDITIDGPGSLKATALHGAGISVSGLNTLTIRNEATVEVIGYDGLNTTTNPTCTPEGGPDDYVLDGDAAKLHIINSNLIAKTTQDDAFYAAIQGFEIPTLEDAEITFPENARFAYECIWSDALCGLVLDNEYVREATITKTGATAIDQVNHKFEIINHKFMKDGQLFIQCGEHLFNAQGKIVK